MLVKATPDRIVTRPRGQTMVACGEIDDFLPSRPGTGEYFFVVGGALQMGSIDKKALRRPIAVEPPIRINRVLLLAKSSPELVLLVEEAPKQEEEHGRLWRVSITGDKATAEPEAARTVAEYKRDFRNARCAHDDKQCLHIVGVSTSSFVDIEPGPGALREPYLSLDFRVYRALFHPIRANTVLLLASCKKQ